jgi:hypothetical protein
MRYNRSSLSPVGCRSLVAGSLALAALVASAGCGDGKIRRYPVTGTVTVDGKPADGALVIFCPVNPTGELEHLRPAGKADAAGTFSLTTIETGDGAPAGDYKVLVQWPTPVQNANEDRGGRARSRGPDRLKGKYYNLEKTPLTAKVDEKSNTLQPFELKSK